MGNLLPEGPDSPLLLRDSAALLADGAAGECEILGLGKPKHEVGRPQLGPLFRDTIFLLSIDICPFVSDAICPTLLTAYILGLFRANLF